MAEFYNVVSYRVDPTWTHYAHLSDVTLATLETESGYATVFPHEYEDIDPLPDEVGRTNISIPIAGNLFVYPQQLPAPYPAAAGGTGNFTVRAKPPLELTKLTGKPVVLNVEFTASSTSTFSESSDTIDVDVGKFLVGAIVVASVRWARSPYLQRAVLSFSGLLASTVSGFLEVSVRYGYRQTGIVSNQYDGIDFAVNINVRGSLVRQVGHLIS